MADHIAERVIAAIASANEARIADIDRICVVSPSDAEALNAWQGLSGEEPLRGVVGRGFGCTVIPDPRWHGEPLVTSLRGVGRPTVNGPVNIT